ncbi:flagellar basal body-associated FliL family protein [Marinobacter sp. F3R08]|uniref:flagellar basal body-associated FliL family protein n=1 Tax=Marinobacter sp. F3R08 TaxID=2841559 RepID=UPI001C0A615C|nr:flagellar basal body-associated FliL family protein [Marinobacter sp. F3R08]MBU2954723.1 flagellar basal body-associated FliL family protein [Marinobacter sp. F3R08]
MTRQPKSALTLLFLLFVMITFPAVSLGEESTEEEVAEQESGVTDYISMDPPFVTHVGSPGSKPTYLKATISLRAKSASARPAIEAHIPRLRHELVMLFGEQTDTDRLTSMEGQEALREEAKQRINAVLEEQQTGENIAGVLFTEFVVQK